MTDRYAVFGNPIVHSMSPWIHARFAAQTGQALTYEAQLVPLDDLALAVDSFRSAGGKGANITVPFKEDAFTLCSQRTARAERAGAVNTLVFNQDAVLGDNTDGAGLIRDLLNNLGHHPHGRRLLLLGAGGAARGVLAPLLECQPSCLIIANRSQESAARLAASVSDLYAVQSCGFQDLKGLQFDMIINATSASLSGQNLPLPSGIYAKESLAYDMMYGPIETRFITQSKRMGAAFFSDGLGMLVEQAAEAFALWRGIHPDTAPVLTDLRQQISDK